MSAATATRTSVDIRPTFARVVRSEWIKLRSLRSTIWVAGITIAVMAAFAGLFAWAVVSFPDSVSTSAGVIVVGYPIAQLAISVLGVLVITGEYATGSFRSTLAAEPRRLRVVASKALVLLVSAFVVSVVALALSAAVAIPVMQAGGIEVRLAADDIRILIGTALYLTISAWFAFGIGLLVKNTAAAITTVVGILFILPIIVQLIAATTGAEWLRDLYSYLPAPAGSAVVSGGAMGFAGLEPWAGLAVFGGYTAAALAVGTVAFVRRDE